MPRVTEEEVKEIMSEEVSEAAIMPQITASNIIVNRVINGTILAEEHLKEIERWLAAHFVYMSIQRETRRERAMDVEEAYAMHLGLGLDNTRYGQQAQLLDTTGNLKVYNRTSKRNILFQGFRG